MSALDALATAHSAPHSRLGRGYYEARARLLADLPQAPTEPPPAARTPGDRVPTARGPAVVSANGTDLVALSALDQLEAGALPPVASAPASAGPPASEATDLTVVLLQARFDPTDLLPPTDPLQRGGPPGLSELLNSVLA